jgi:threonine dehydratase
VPPISEFIHAHQRLAEFLDPSPMAELPGFGADVGARVFVKQENLLPTRSFKLRGAANRLVQLSTSELARGVVTASTGNHAYAVAHVARALGADAVVVLPRSEAVSDMKVAAVKALGAELRQVGTTYTEAVAGARRVAIKEGRTLIADGPVDPAIMVGAGTVGWEIAQSRPSADVMLVPVGGGNLISGVAACAKQLQPSVQIVGVAAQGAPAAYRAWSSGELTHVVATTFAGGLAADNIADGALPYLRQFVDDIVRVSDDELRRAMVIGFEQTGTVVEPAGAAAIAALLRFRERWSGKEVVAVLSGGNATLDDLLEARDGPASPAGASA